MSAEYECIFDRYQNVVILRLMGQFDYESFTVAAGDINRLYFETKARGIIVQACYGQLAIREEDYPALAAFFAAEYAGIEPPPVSIVSRKQFREAAIYARHAFDAGRPVRACLTYAEALAWIDFCHGGDALVARHDILMRLHEVTSSLSEAEIEEVLEAIEAHVAPRLYSCEEILGEHPSHGKYQPGPPPAT